MDGIVDAMKRFCCTNCGGVSDDTLNQRLTIPIVVSKRTSMEQWI